MSAETEAESSENTVPNSKCKKRLAAIAALILCVAAAVCFCLIRKVPDVRGNTADAAREAIEDAGLEYSESREFSTEVERGMVISQSPSDGIARRGSDVEVTISRGIPVTVPDLVGKDMDDAKEMPEVSELKLTTTGKEFSDTLSKGLIIRQDPYPGTECEEGSEISVVISKGITQVTVPAVTGKTTEEAIAVLEKEGFKVAVNSQYSGYAAGTIAYQSVEGGDTADIHSEITITESLGAAPAKKSRSKKSGKSKPKSDVFG